MTAGAGKTPAPIAVRGIVNRFGDHVVHNGIDLEVRPGEVLSVVGGSGSGKTVLLNCMIGLRVPTAGTVEVFGEPLTGGVRERSRTTARHSGVLFQHGALFTALTVAENVGFPLRELDGFPRDLIRPIVNLKLFLAGLKPVDGERLPADLSGGMIKRAALARALARDPELVFLDEPTSGLDPLSARRFVALIAELRASLGLTVVMITHDRETLEAVSDRVAVLADRKLIALGPVEAVRQVDHPFIKDYFRDG
ncbi:MAG: ATP-binding cassette domain-containing protein [Pseudomonadota bacterium]